MSLRAYFKRLGRKTAKAGVRFNRVATPLLSGVGTFIGGPVVGAAITAGHAEIGRYHRATQARHEGDYARARDLGRGERQRVAIYGAAGLGAGMLASGITAAVQGGNIFTQTLLGQGGSQLFGVGGTNAFTSAPQAALNKTAALPGVSTPGAGAAKPNLAWQMVNGVPVYAPEGSVGAPMYGTLTSQGLPVLPMAADMAAAGASNPLWGQLLTGAAGAGQIAKGVLQPPAPSPNKQDMDNLTAKELAELMAMMSGGGGNGDPSDSRGPRNAATGEGGIPMWLLVAGGLLLLSAA